ncbi:MAG: hypothetical protein P1P84_02780 [Deferrisomatales bacterium]|nr:hypothetical protein [Deferrisomatales bacterium]
MQRIIVTVEKGKLAGLDLYLEQKGTGTNADEMQVAAALQKVIRGVLVHFSDTFDRHGETQ